MDVTEVVKKLHISDYEEEVLDIVGFSRLRLRYRLIEQRERCSLKERDVQSSGASRCSASWGRLYHGARTEALYKLLIPSWL